MIGKLRFRLGLAGLYGEIGFRGCNGLYWRLTGIAFLAFDFVLVILTGEIGYPAYIWPSVCLFVNTVLKTGCF